MTASKKTTKATFADVADKPGAPAVKPSPVEKSIDELSLKQREQILGYRGQPIVINGPVYGAI